MTTTSYTSTDEYGTPADVEVGGVRCGNHLRTWGIRHENTAAVRACYAISQQMAAEQHAECYAEAVMSWVAGGGDQADASRYASVVASGGTWDGGIGDSPMTGETCEHGMDAGLCMGPAHYATDEEIEQGL